MVENDLDRKIAANAGPSHAAMEIWLHMGKLKDFAREKVAYQVLLAHIQKQTHNMTVDLSAKYFKLLFLYVSF